MAQEAKANSKPGNTIEAAMASCIKRIVSALACIVVQVLLCSAGLTTMVGGLLEHYFRGPFPDMPAYFEGEEVPPINAPWVEATMVVGNLLRDIDGKLKPRQDLQLEVTDEFRNLL